VACWRTKKAISRKPVKIKDNEAELSQAAKQAAKHTWNGEIAFVQHLT